MEKLKIMSLTRAEYVTEAFATLAWKCPLKVLALDNCDELPFTAFRKLAERFKATLEVLDVVDTPVDSSEGENKANYGQQFDLPLLNTLSLVTLHGPELLDMFESAPIKEFEIGFSPAIEFEHVEKFIAARSGDARKVGVPKLEKVTVQGTHNFTEGQIESLEVSRPALVPH